MINFEEALNYLRIKKVTGYDMFKETGKSSGLLNPILSGNTKNPRKETKEVFIRYALKLMKENNENLVGEPLIDDNLMLYKNDPFYIKKLALEARKNKRMLFKEPIFADLVYMEALSLALKAKKGDIIDINELMKLRPE